MLDDLPPPKIGKDDLPQIDSDNLPQIDSDDLPPPKSYRRFGVNHTSTLLLKITLHKQGCQVLIICLNKPYSNFK